MGNTKENISSTYSINRYTNMLPRNYHNFVISKWMRSYRYSNDYMRLADSGAYFGAYQLYTRTILSNPFTEVRIACLTHDPDVALGFSVTRGSILDYVHVHKDFRKQGIGKKLVPPNIKTFTHLTKTGMKLWPTKMPSAKFNPFA